MDPQSYVQTLGQSARRAAQQLVTLDGATRAAAIGDIAGSIHHFRGDILKANEKDLAATRDAQLAPALVERLRLDEKRVIKMADALRQIADQPDPIGQTIEASNRPNGLRVEKRRV